MWDYVTPQDFGAVGDGFTDDLAAFQAAVMSKNPVYVPWTPNGYALSGTLYLYGSPYTGSNPPPPTWQILEGRGALLKAAPGFTASALIQIGGSVAGQNGWYVNISGLSFDMTNATSYPCAAIYFDTADQPYTTVNEMAYIRLTDLTFQNCFMAITDVLHPTTVTANTVPVSDLQVKNVLCRLVGGRPQFALARSMGFILFRDVHIDLEFNTFPWPTTGPLNFLNTYPVAYAQFGLVSIGLPSGFQTTSQTGGVALIGGLEFERFDINSGNSTHNGLDNSPAGLTIIGDLTAMNYGPVYLTRTLLDLTAGDGINVQNVAFLFGKDVYSSNTSLHGLVVSNVTYANLVNVCVVDANAGNSGIYVTGCQSMNMANVICADSNGAQGGGAAGLRIVNSQFCHFANVQAIHNYYGVFIVSGSADIQLANVYAGSNTLEGGSQYGNKNHGVYLLDSMYCHIVNAVSANNGYGATAYGFYSNFSSEQSGGNVFVNIFATNNPSGSLYINDNLTTHGSAAADWIPNSGTLRQLDETSASTGVNTSNPVNQ